jgi:hypothetical protein
MEWVVVAFRTPLALNSLRSRTNATVLDKNGAGEKAALFGCEGARWFFEYVIVPPREMETNAPQSRLGDSPPTTFVAAILLDAGRRQAANSPSALTQATRNPLPRLSMTLARSPHWRIAASANHPQTPFGRRAPHPVVHYLAAALDGTVEATGAVFEAKFMRRGRSPKRARPMWAGRRKPLSHNIGQLANLRR